MSTSAVKLSVILPCFNEAASAQRLESILFPALDRLGTTYEVVAVNDGSTDTTARTLEEIASRRPQLRLLSHAENRGLGAALRTGWNAASGEWIVCLDADMTFHPDLIADLLAAQSESGADCVSGSPFLGGMPGIPWSRRLPSLLLNAFYRGLLNMRLTSYTPMFRLYRAEDLRSLDIVSDGFEISVEALARLLRAKRIVREIPAPLTVRTDGVSKLRRWRELKNHLRLIARLILS